MAFGLQIDVLAGVAPLVRPAVGELVREVVVVEVHPVEIAVEVLPVFLTVHEDLHGLAPVLQKRDEQHSTDRNHEHEDLDARAEQGIEEALGVLPPRHGDEAILHVEVRDRVDRRIVDAADDPRRAVQWAHDRVLQTHDGVRASHPPVRAHRFLARQRKVGTDRLDGACGHRAALWQRRKRGPSRGTTEKARHGSQKARSIANTLGTQDNHTKVAPASVA
mmetsp:Transcript_82567/g.230214  ORF Transcript_82567/g.230214 Transcript_82567/m.230214 type:complete len:220 (-) Transcript_82567:13-672(-)